MRLRISLLMMIAAGAVLIAPAAASSAGASTSGDTGRPSDGDNDADDACAAAPDWGGIWRVEPEISWAVGESPFAAASALTLSPSAAATDDSVSPGATTWTK